MQKVSIFGLGTVGLLTNSILVFITLLVFINVLLRYVFNSPLTYSFDLSTLLFAWLIFLGVAIVQKNQEHMGFNLIDTLLPPKLVVVVTVLRELLILGISLYLVYIGYQMVQRVGTDIPSMGISSKYLYAALPFGFFLNALVCMGNLVKLAKQGGKQ
ncbi:TRAP transporter small permease [Vibrio nigripulchritudo]|nr:TRAP transporter small permease [Vibrio nigripulchritudo]